MKKKKLLYLILLVIILGTVPAMVGCNKSNQASTVETNKLDFDNKDKKATQGTIGFLSLDISDKEVIKNIGKPKEKSQAYIWEADGAEHQTWVYSNKGIELDMIRDSIGENKWSENQTVSKIIITSPCDYKTKENIGIGSSKNEVINVYKNGINKEDSSEDLNKIVLGTIYDGIIFNFEEDKVVKIFVGAAAE